MKRYIIAIVCWGLLLMGLFGCGKKAEPVQSFEENPGSGMRRTTLYFATEDGYMVPVMKSIPWEEGIGKAALSYLVGGADNDRSACAMGLKTVIPEGTRYTLRIGENKAATVNLSGYTPHETKLEEQAMVVAIVNTLSEFDSIDTVRITLDGKERASLPNGTDISKAMESFDLNVEQSEVPVSGTSHKITLYFPNISASLNIPVTRYIDKMPSFSGAVQELIKGSGDSRLLNCIPEGTELRSAYIGNGIASVEFDSTFTKVEAVDGKLEAVRDALYLCANEFEQVYGVDIYVDGAEYSMHTSTAAAPVYVNEFR